MESETPMKVFSASSFFIVLASSVKWSMILASVDCSMLFKALVCRISLNEIEPSDVSAPKSYHFTASKYLK